ncbi:MAG: hypothetical protein IKR76_06060 [Ruminococcus sp.]|nr:hypothetical protein [Ruminococcus sp.]
MRGLNDKLILFLLSLLLIPSSQVGFKMAAMSVAVFCICCILTVFPKWWVRAGAAALFIAGCLIYPQASVLVAPFAYCVFESRDKRQALLVLPILLVGVSVSLRTGLCCAAYALLAAVLCYRRVTFEDKDEELKATRDYGVENSLVLMERNKRLIEQQNSEISLATLKERNRIAREIHDNVGHVLSRSLLQLGAVMAVTKNDEKMTSLLQPVRESMDLALDSIRKSVHDLRDDSIDLKSAAEEILKPLEGSYRIDRQYDFSDSVDKDTRLCIIAVLKEAVTNIIRHSDADTVSVTITEHPAFLQLVIDDNGKNVKSPDSEGMGLANMKERVKMLDGIINITSEHGFRIFITIPKKNERGESNEDNSSR